MLFDFLLRGLFEHRLIHADPNLANFSFLADGRVVVYDFGCDDELLRRIVENNLSQFGEAKDIRFPHHIIFINRTAAGHFGNLSRLRAAAPWRRMLEARLS